MNAAIESPTTTTPAIPASAIQTAVNGFQRVFGSRPRFAATAPGRVNLIGEHTDYNDGFVLPIAIDRVCACVAAPASESTSIPSASAAAQVGRVCSFSLEAAHDSAPASSDVTSVRPTTRIVNVDWAALHAQGPAYLDTLAPSDRWVAYVLGVVELFRRECDTRAVPSPPPLPPLPPLNIAVASAVPLGSGLSSSASLEVAVCTMLEEASGVHLSKIEKARLCQRAEHEYARVPCGIMDQYASVFGEQDRALLLDCRFGTHTPVVLPPPDNTGAAIVVVNSNVRHELAAGEYAKRRQACQDIAGSLGIRSLRDVDLTDDSTVDELMESPEDWYGLAMHVISENQRTRHVAMVCERVAAGRTTWKRALPEIGERMVQSHESLRDGYKVSCAELDALVEIAMSVRGVYGARMTGGGFGGCIIALVRPLHLDDLKQALDAEYPKRTGKTCTMFVVRASEGAKGVTLNES